MHRGTKLINLLLIFAFTSVAWADPQNTMPLPEIGNWQVQDPLGAWPFIGAGMGYADYNDSVRTEGVPTHVKMIGSYYFANRRWVSDVEIGLNNHILSQSGANSDNILTANLGFAARFRLPRGFQAGPTWNTFIGSDRYNSVNDLNTSFIGAELLKEWSLKEQYLLRVGGKLMTDIDINGEQVNMGLVQVAVGFIPQRTGDSLTAIERGQRAIVAQTAQGRATPIAVKVPAVNIAQFELNSTRLNSPANRKLESLSKVLKENSDLFGRIKIIGHADPSGPDHLNNRLARARAQNVADIFKRSGFATETIEVSSLGAKAPIIESYELDDLAKSRRVEIQFLDVKNRSRLEQLLGDF
jgi:OmpA-OmpF porin, OOP family